MYISPLVVQALHEDRIRDAQRYARPRTVVRSQSVSLINRISNLLHVRPQHETTDARHAHAL